MIILFWFVTASKKGHGDAAGSAAFQLRRRGFFFRPRRWCFVGTAFWGRAILFCFAAVLHVTSILCRRVFFLRSRDIGDSLPRPLGAARHCFVLPWPFLGHATSILRRRGFFAAARYWGFFAAFWGRVTFFSLPRSFFWVRDIDPSSSRLFLRPQDIGVLSVRPLGAARHCLRCPFSARTIPSSSLILGRMPFGGSMPF